MALVTVEAMDFDSFISLLTLSQPPADLSPPLRALWFDRNGKWSKAHEEIQNEGNPQSAAVHAYLHRKEGDMWNARYWYKTAQRRECRSSLELEWELLTRELLREGQTEAQA